GAGERREEQVGGVEGGGGRGVSEGRDAGMDEVRMRGHDLGDEAGSRTLREERFEHEIDTRRERVEDATDRRSGVPAIERQREAPLARIGRVPEEPALAAVRAAEARREPATRVATRWLDLDHLHAGVDQETAAEVAERIRQIEGAEPLQGGGHEWRASSTAPGTLTEPASDRSAVPPRGAPAPAAGARPRLDRAAC